MVGVSHAPDLAEERVWLAGVLTRQIPLGSAMRLSIERLDPAGVLLAAPLEPNINDKGTAFGGALVSMMILAGWSLPRLLLRRARCDADLVIGRCEVRFLKPVRGPVRAECDWPDEPRCAEFMDDLERNSKAALTLVPRLCTVDGAVAATLEARYAALAGPDARSGSPESSGGMR